MTSFAENIKAKGFAIIPGGLEPLAIPDWTQKLDQVLTCSDAAIKNRKGTVYAARNIITEVSEACSLWQTDYLKAHLCEILGDDFVLVRALYFDKHPQRTWSLPWHKDMTIAVKDNTLPTTAFSKPTNKLGVPHVEASTEVLQNMLTLRFHLDEVTDENGPLEVIPGSHHGGKTSDHSGAQPVKIHANAGDVLAMRPILSHASGSSIEGTFRPRRILHFEFSGDRELPDGYQWYFQPGSFSATNRTI